MTELSLPRLCLLSAVSAGIENDGGFRGIKM
jgi:hypothetical protein